MDVKNRYIECWAEVVEKRKRELYFLGISEKIYCMLNPDLYQNRIWMRILIAEFCMTFKYLLVYRYSRVPVPPYRYLFSGRVLNNGKYLFKIYPEAKQIF
jgi:hypothetical protein